MIFWQFQADGFELRIITAVAFTLERPAIKLGPRSKSPEIQFGPCMNQISTKVISFWFGSSWKFTFQGFSHRFSISLDVFCKKNTGIYFDFVETDNTRDGWYLWCSICINLNAVFKKCLVISYCPTVSSCVYIYICTHQFLTLLRHKVHMNDSTEMKDIWCNCEDRFLPISNTEKLISGLELILWHQQWADTL